MIRIPKRFFDDHRERDLDTPEIVRETKEHYFISDSDPALDEFYSDAEFYSVAMDFHERGLEHLIGLVRSAQATRNAIDKARSN